MNVYLCLAKLHDIVQPYSRLSLHLNRGFVADWTPLALRVAALVSLHCHLSTTVQGHFWGMFVGNVLAVVLKNHVDHGGISPDIQIHVYIYI